MLLLVCPTHRISVEEAPAEGAGEITRLLEVALQAHSLISMSRTNRASLWSITRLHHPAEAVSLEAEATLEVAQARTIHGAISVEGPVVDSTLGVAEISAAEEGGAGGIGRRCVSS